MKTFKAICATVVLVLSLSIPAYSDSTTPGDGHSPGTPIPNPTGNPTTTPKNGGVIGASSSADGDLSTQTLVDILWALASIY